MNEYRVTIDKDGVPVEIVAQAETAGEAHDKVEDETRSDVIEVKFVRALSFSCRMRGR